MAVLGLVHCLKDDPELLFVLLAVNAFVHEVQTVVERIAALNIGKHLLRQMKSHMVQRTVLVRHHEPFLVIFRRDIASEVISFVTDQLHAFHCNYSQC